MKKIIVGIFCVSFLLSCSVFKKQEKYGCPSDGRNVGAEKLASGDDAKLMKKARKAKFKG